MFNKEIESYNEAKLRAFCEGLEMNNIDKLMSGTPGDFRKIGEEMAKRIQEMQHVPPISDEEFWELIKED